MKREEAIFYIKELQKTYAPMDKKVAEAVDMATEALSSNMVEVVKCKDCYNNVPQSDDDFTWCNYFCDYVRLEHYCSYGERLE